MACVGRRGERAADVEGETGDRLEKLPVYIPNSVPRGIDTDKTPRSPFHQRKLARTDLNLPQSSWFRKRTGPAPLSGLILQANCVQCVRLCGHKPARRSAMRSEEPRQAGQTLRPQRSWERAAMRETMAAVRQRSLGRHPALKGPAHRLGLTASCSGSVLVPEPHNLYTTDDNR
ncbi:hypothetical protein BC628DRAFT_425505 [Trametes gibbosa]|nr:hypothetical protein BC628DRAFT_425505 [Trametes gibbosa]